MIKSAIDATTIVSDDNKINALVRSIF